MGYVVIILHEQSQSLPPALNRSWFRANCIGLL